MVTCSSQGSLAKDSFESSKNYHIHQERPLIPYCNAIKAPIKQPLITFHSCTLCVFSHKTNLLVMGSSEPTVHCRFAKGKSKIFRFKIQAMKLGFFFYTSHWLCWCYILVRKYFPASNFSVVRLMHGWLVCELHQKLHFFIISSQLLINLL